MNLRVVEKEDLPLVSGWMVNPDFLGEHVALRQKSRMDWQKRYDSIQPEEKWFLIEKKDRTKVGFIQHYPVYGFQELGYVMVRGERGKGHCTEAVGIMVDCLFLSKNIVRIQATTNAENIASQKVLEKVGFRKEGTIRKEEFIRGEWRDTYLYSILREEWKEPKILTRA